MAPSPRAVCLAQGNQGDYERDVFAFAPEANFKLGYRFRKNVLLSVGLQFHLLGQRGFERRRR